jgi:hypothetical protein
MSELYSRMDVEPEQRLREEGIVCIEFEIPTYVAPNAPGRRAGGAPMMLPARVVKCPKCGARFSAATQFLLLTSLGSQLCDNAKFFLSEFIGQPRVA